MFSSVITKRLSRYAPLIVILLGLGLAAPALTAEFTADDHLHRLVARDDTGIDGLRSRPFDLFVFASGDPADATRLRDAGVFPWWTDLNVRLAFWRPVTSATHAADHALWPDSARLQLLHNLAWLALVLVLVWRFYRRFLDARRIAVLALLLYAVDDARGPVVGWIANRNALVALALALPVLLAHDRWRRDGWAPGRWLSPLLLLPALLAGEAALAITAYLAAHALWLDRAPWRDRLLALAPHAAVVLVWRIAYEALGYGVAGSGVYIDPGADPIGFALSAAERIPLLLLGQLALPWSDLGSLYEMAGPWTLELMWLIALAVLLAIALVAVRLLRRDATARFFATGMILAALPIASTFPADRLLGFVGLGGMGLVAQLIAAAVADRSLLGDRWPRRAAAITVIAALATINVILAPPLLVARSRSMVTIGRVLDRADAGIPHDASIASRTVIIANPPSDAFAGYLPLMRASRGQPRPAHIYWLATGTTAVTLERVGERTLRIIPDGGFLRYEVDQMLHTRSGFREGDHVALSGVTIVIETVRGGNAFTALAHFDRPLDDPSFLWLRWGDKTYVPYTPPAVGARETLPRVDMLQLLE